MRKANAQLNGEWGRSVPRWRKRLTAKKRRAQGKRAAQEK